MIPWHESYLDLADDVVRQQLRLYGYMDPDEARSVAHLALVEVWQESDAPEALAQNAPGRIERALAALRKATSHSHFGERSIHQPVNAEGLTLADILPAIASEAELLATPMDDAQMAMIRGWVASLPDPLRSAVERPKAIRELAEQYGVSEKLLHSHRRRWIQDVTQNVRHGRLYPPKHPYSVIPNWIWERVINLPREGQEALLERLVKLLYEA